MIMHTSRYPVIIPSGPFLMISIEVRGFDGSNKVRDIKSGSRSQNLINFHEINCIASLTVIVIITALLLFTITIKYYY